MMDGRMRTLGVALTIAFGFGLATVNAGVSLQATLTPGQEVPPVTAPGAGGTATLTFDDETSTIEYQIQVQGLSGPAVAAHIHQAPRGQANPAFLSCCNLSVAGTTFTGTTQPLTAEQVVALFNEGLYVNVHTDANPGGEIRGQIELTPGACDCDLGRGIVACVKALIKPLDKDEKRDPTIKALKRAVKKSACGKNKVGKKTIACCVKNPLENFVTDTLCVAVKEKACSKVLGVSRGAGSSCLPTSPCSPSGAFLDTSAAALF